MEEPRPSAWILLPPIFCAILLLATLAFGRNVQVFLWLNHLGRFASDNFWIFVTTLGDGLVLLVLVLPFVWRAPKIAWALVIAWLLVALLIKGIKLPILMYRPVALLSPDQFRLVGPAYRYNSFPSGHAASAAAYFATIGIYYRQRWVRAAAVMLVLIIAYSRIAMGLHWPTDVLCGFMGGWILALPAYWLSKRFTFGSSRAAQFFLSFAIGPAAVAMFFINHTDYSPAHHLLQAISLAAVLFALCDCLLIHLRAKSRRLHQSEIASSLAETA